MKPRNRTGTASSFQEAALLVLHELPRRPMLLPQEHPQVALPRVVARQALGELAEPTCRMSGLCERVSYGEAAKEPKNTARNEGQEMEC